MNLANVNFRRSSRYDVAQTSPEFRHIGSFAVEKPICGWVLLRIAVSGWFGSCASEAASSPPPGRVC
jgi:hypothetical protein